ncbi:hypothetical protein DFH27DRAFT_514925 [Peziza echinospora]|nr:hypothetical protein DFH27DRAFT_514925 [Peziza echinospora]
MRVRAGAALLPPLHHHSAPAVTASIAIGKSISGARSTIYTHQTSLPPPPLRIFYSSSSYSTTSRNSNSRAFRALAAASTRRRTKTCGLESLYIQVGSARKLHIQQGTSAAINSKAPKMAAEFEVSPDLADEIEALNCIYGEDCLTGPLHTSSGSSTSATGASSTSSHTFLLHPPDLPQPVTFRILIPIDYPTGGRPPTVSTLSVEGRRPRAHDDDTSEESTWLLLARDIMRNVYENNGSTAVCLYEFIEGMKEILPPPAPEEPPSSSSQDRSPSPTFQDSATKLSAMELGWHASLPHLENKSTFIAHALPFQLPPPFQSSPSPHALITAQIQKLIDSDKHLQRATHNIWAYRMRRESDGAVFQDNDDDGETAAGQRVGHLLGTMGVWNVVVVVSRWYGGVKLGGDRFRIIGKVAREAVVAAVGEPGEEGGKDGKAGEKEKEKGGKKKGKKH